MWKVGIEIPRSLISLKGKTDIAGLTLSEYARVTNAKLVLSGGYLASFSPALPLGLVMKSGVVISRAHTSWLTDGILCLKGGHQAELRGFGEGPGVVSTGTDCLQAGPILVNDAKIVFGAKEPVPTGPRKLLDSFQNQSFVCVDKDGDLIFGVSEPINLEALLPILAEQTMNAGLGCKNSMRLSGSITAGLYV